MTSPWYQPFAFGAVVGAPVIVGAVSSTSIPSTFAVSLLPAASTAVPVADCPAPSPKFTGVVHDAIPERESEHTKLTATSRLYQPFAFGSRPGAPEIVGFVLSTLTLAVSVALFPALSTAVPTTGWS